MISERRARSMTEYRNGYKVGKDGLTGPERSAQERAENGEGKAQVNAISLRERLADAQVKATSVHERLVISAGLRPHPDDTVFVKEYSSPLNFKQDAKKLAKEGWVPTSQSQTRGRLIGWNK